MPEAYTVDALRTPIGRRRGALASVHPADLGAHVLRALVERTGIDPAAVDDVIFGCVDTIGPQAGDIARTAWLAAGLPESVPGVTLDRQCGSSQQALHFAAQAVMSDTQDVVVVGGVQTMSQVPIQSSFHSDRLPGYDDPDPYVGSAGWRSRYGDDPVSQFRSAELIAAKWDLDRAELESYALESHRRAVVAIDEGRFAGEVSPCFGLTADEGPRRDTSLEKMAALPTLLPDGRVTAATSSQVSDGAAAMLVVSEEALHVHGLTPRARVHQLSVVGADPIFMLTAPIPATQHALARSGLSLDDIDLIEMNEAFAPVVLAWQRDTGADLARVNVNGGAIALGHPLGASGARLMTTLLAELDRTGGRFGLQVMCEGGGQSNATIVERLG